MAAHSPSLSRAPGLTDRHVECAVLDRFVDACGRVRTRLRRMRYRPGLLNGFLARTGLGLVP